MGINLAAPRGSFFRPCAAIFTALYNDPTVGKYDFSVAGNRNVSILGINPQSVYFLSILNFSTTITESAYIENIETIPAVDFKLKQNGSQLYGQGYPLVAYLVNNEVGAFFTTEQTEDELIVTFTGLLGQSASLATVPQIIAQVSANIHEITDEKFKAWYHNEVKQAGFQKVQVAEEWKDRI